MQIVRAVSVPSAILAAILAGPGAAQESLKPAAPGPQKPPAARRYDPTGQYEAQSIEGWRVLVNREFLRRDATLADSTLTLLRFQLYQITRRLPAAPLGRLRRIAIWVEQSEPHHPCMAYHPDAGWLRDHGMNPDKARCVEIANARNFLTWTIDQPWMVLHELAHGYHDQFLGGYGNPEIRAAYDRVIKARLYDAVLRAGGATERAYAATNPMEYFAETTEAFFGTNDFYPFVRAELRQHDPQTYQLLERLWELPKKS